MKQPTCEACMSTDKSRRSASYYALATNAYSIGNSQEAENYCDKIIETEPESPKAWMLKGAACAWQFTVENNKMHEFLSCAQKAFNYSPNLEILNFVAEFLFKEFYSLCLAVNQQKINSIAPFNGQCAKHLNTAEYSANRLALLLWYRAAYGKLAKCTPNGEMPELLSFEALNLGDMDLRIYQQIEDAALSIWYDSLFDFSSENSAHANNYSFEKIIEIYAHVSSVLGYLITQCKGNLSSCETDFTVRICKELISVKKEVLSIKPSEFLKSSILADVNKYLDLIKMYEPHYNLPEELSPEF